MALAVSIAAIIGAPVGVVSVYYMIRGAVRSQATARSEELQEKYNAGLSDGIKQAQPASELLRSQRDDARRERDNERADRLACERRVNDLEDELRRRGAGT